MNILIFGASGKTGKHLVQQALDDGHLVTGFVRNPDKVTAKHKNLILHQGNVSDFSAVQQAVTGQQAVFSVLGADNMFKLDKVIIDGMANIISAMKAASLSRLIYLSTLGVSETRRDAGFIIHNLVPTLLPTEIKGHEVRETMIRESDLIWTIVRPPILTNGPLTKSYRSGENLVSAKFATTLSRTDVADFMLSQLVDTRFIRKSVRLMPSQ